MRRALRAALFLELARARVESLVAEVEGRKDIGAEARGELALKLGFVLGELALAAAPGKGDDPTRSIAGVTCGCSTSFAVDGDGRPRQAKRDCSACEGSGLIAARVIRERARTHVDGVGPKD